MNIVVPLSQSPSEPTIVKRGRGRPLGSKNRPKNIPMDEVGLASRSRGAGEVDLDTLFEELPSLGMTPDERKEALRLVNKNTSIRLSFKKPEEARLAILIIWLNKKRNVKKATFLKECFKLGVPVYLKTQNDAARLDT